jgi:hypothetical protein
MHTQRVHERSVVDFGELNFRHRFGKLKAIKKK